MPLPTTGPRIPTAIADIGITLTDYVATPDEAAHKEGRYSVQVWDQDGNIMKVLQGDLVPHLTSGQITALMGFMDSLRVKAEDEILP